jgi:hypothetical protein
MGSKPSAPVVGARYPSGPVTIPLPTRADRLPSRDDDGSDDNDDDTRYVWRQDGGLVRARNRLVSTSARPWQYGGSLETTEL